MSTWRTNHTREQISMIVFSLFSGIVDSREEKELFDYVGLLVLSEVIEGICPQSEVIGGENRTEHNTANSVPYSLRLVCDLINVPQFYEH